MVEYGDIMNEKNNPNASQRQQEVDWSDWNGSSVQPEDFKSQPVGINPHHGGQHVTKEDLRKDGEKIIAGAKAITAATKGIRQPTDEELFGHLVRPKQELEQMEKDWNNFFNDTLQEARKPIDEKIKKQLPVKLEEAWESGRSFNDIIGEEEARKRGQYVGK